ncbi:Phosphoribosylglycinamide formyltransferase [Pseudobythopirellula maris]|uniref:Phosphoribosylglycinamide formyltransferase n=1 Tax=Pseudobythopirellula maris TaxID=2527991 RepID=A0A5C5ZU71_9BACT|nr:phosphoribosylglycinamide formyltransferase [Pseudobythopirellula maris]TWT90645.1 Phosphoribosylglycinamide formyltransferase [Pseudobythopirellula maris]
MKIAVLISGGGRTLKNILDLAAKEELKVDVRLVVSSSAKAGGLAHAEAAGVPSVVFARKDYDSHDAYGEAVFDACREAGVELVVMAGFLKLAPVPDDFMGRVVNIHPSLIPAFCGQGMHGDHVHTAAIERGVRVSGVTVHFVDNEYDHGPIIWQQPTPVFDDDTPATLAARVFELEKEAYPHVLKLFAAGRVQLEDGRVRIGKGRKKQHG